MWGGEVFVTTAVHSVWTGVRNILPHAERFQRFFSTVSREDCWNMLNGAIRGTSPQYDPLLAQVFWANGIIRSYGKSMFWQDVCPNEACQHPNQWGYPYCTKCNTPLTQKELANSELQPNGWGCTFAVVVLVCDLKTGRKIIHYYWEGDPLIFLVLDGKLEVLSKEQVETVVSDNKTLTVLSRWLGRCDIPGGERGEREIPPSAEGWVGIGSDGLSNMLSPDHILQVLMENGTCQVLVDEALAVPKPYNETHTTGDDNMLVATATFQKKENSK
jgi:hypothetical protein